MIGNVLHTYRFSFFGESTFLFSANRFRFYDIIWLEYFLKKNTVGYDILYKPVNGIPLLSFTLY